MLQVCLILRRPEHFAVRFSLQAFSLLCSSRPTNGSVISYYFTTISQNLQSEQQRNFQKKKEWTKIRGKDKEFEIMQLRQGIKTMLLSPPIFGTVTW
jgi:ubiquinone/menaquinone biosynthesis C-methylase UbiE